MKAPEAPAVMPNAAFMKNPATGIRSLVSLPMFVKR
jgi:hypothetical protein